MTTFLHPRNKTFEWKPTRPPYQILLPAQVRQYDQEGYFLLESAFTREEVATIATVIDPFERKAEEYVRAAGGQVLIAKAGAITFAIHLVIKSNELKAFSRHPLFQRLCHDILGSRARLYWDQAVYKKPGNPEEFPWHQDNGYTYVEPQQYLTCWVALTDATIENGCPWVVPGLHRKGTLAHHWTPLGWQCLDDPEDAIAVPAKAGDIVVFSSLTPHRTGPNLTGTVRKSYILQYACDGSRSYPAGGSEAILQDDPARQYYVADVTL